MLLKNLADHLVNKAEDRTKETREVSAMMGNEDIALPHTSLKDQGQRGSGFHRGLKEDYRIFMWQPRAQNTEQQPVSPEGNTKLFLIIDSYTELKNI